MRRSPEANQAVQMNNKRGELMVSSVEAGMVLTIKW